MKKIIISALLVLILVGLFVLKKSKNPDGHDSANNIYVTDVRVYETGKQKFADISINDLIKINEIQVREIGGRVTLAFPTYISKRGKVYPQVRITSRELNDLIIGKIRNMNPDRSKACSDMNFEVTGLSVYRKAGSSLKAFVVVTFVNFIEIECKILYGKKGLWVAWPSRGESGRWIKQVLIRENFKEKVESVILKRYEVLQQEKGNEWR